MPLFHHLRPIGAKFFKFCRCPAARPSGDLFSRATANASRAVHAALCKVESGAAVSVALDRVRAPRVRLPPRNFVRRRFHSPRAAVRGSGGRAPPASSALLGDGAGPRSAAATQSSSGLRRRRSAPRLGCRCLV